ALAEHDYGLGGGVGLERLEAVDEARARDRVAADADARGDADARLLQLVQGLVGERARPRHDADRTPAEGDLARRDADVALARRDDAGAVGAQQAGAGEVAPQDVERLRLVLRRDALGDAHHELETGLGRLEDGARRT